MPIRMQRGRAAAWRRLWSWPLTSYRHLAVTGAGLAVAALTLGIAVGASDPEESPSAHHPEVVAPSEYTLPTSTVSSEPEDTPLVPPAPVALAAPPEAMQVAQEFATRFAHHPEGMTSQQWADQLRPLLTAESAGLLGSTDPANVDITRLTGPPVATKVTAAVVDVDVPVDTGVLQLTLLDQHGWKVRSYTKQDAG